MISSRNLSLKSNSFPTLETLQKELDKFLVQYAILTKRYSHSMRFHITCAYKLGEIMQSNDIEYIKEVTKLLIKELPQDDMETHQKLIK